MSIFSARFDLMLSELPVAIDSHRIIDAV